MRGEPVTTPAPEPETEAITTRQQEQEAKSYRARTAKKMSWDDYLGLTDQARAAVDFNTMLVQARQKDLRSDYEPTDTQREIYDKAVERMFGDEGVSETYAPETVALLNGIDFKQTDAKRFDDLDDFLGLSAALTAKDLERIGNPGPVETITNALGGEHLGGMLTIGTPNDTNAQVASGLATGTADLREALTRGNQVLENWKQVSAGTRNDMVGLYGGTLNKLAAPDIRVGENADYFQTAYDALADATNDPGVLELIKKDLNDKAYKRFLAYADTKSQYSADRGVGLGGDPAIQYRTPDEFRRLLGLNGGEPSATD
jgi:hypothetical protein